MKNLSFIFVFIFAFVFVLFVQNFFAQEIPTAVLIQIVKAEDELRFDKTLENLLQNKDAKIRARAALAAGQTGKKSAVPALINLLENDASNEVRRTAAFALGEIEDVSATEAIIKVLKDDKTPDAIRARAVEAAGKIAAANPLKKDDNSADNDSLKIQLLHLGEAILDTLETEDRRGAEQNKETILLGLTAILRAKPDEGIFVAAKFLTNLDPRIRADAANTLTRLRAKNLNEKFRAMVLSDNDPIARANAARALGAAEDDSAFNLLLETALTDEDSRVRISAIRSLGNLKNADAAAKLIERGGKLLKSYKKEFYDIAPPEKNELLEIATTLGRILPNSDEQKALKFLNDFGGKDSFNSTEIQTAIAEI